MNILTSKMNRADIKVMCDDEVNCLSQTNNLKSPPRCQVRSETDDD